MTTRSTGSVEQRMNLVEQLLLGQQQLLVHQQQLLGSLGVAHPAVAPSPYPNYGAAPSLPSPAPAPAAVNRRQGPGPAPEVFSTRSIFDEATRGGTVPVSAARGGGINSSQGSSNSSVAGPTSTMAATSSGSAANERKLVQHLRQELEAEKRAHELAKKEFMEQEALLKSKVSKLSAELRDVKQSLDSSNAKHKEAIRELEEQHANDLKGIRAVAEESGRYAVQLERVRQSHARGALLEDYRIMIQQLTAERDQLRNALGSSLASGPKASKRPRLEDNGVPSVPVLGPKISATTTPPPQVLRDGAAGVTPATAEGGLSAAPRPPALSKSTTKRASEKIPVRAPPVVSPPPTPPKLDQRAPPLEGRSAAVAPRGVGSISAPFVREDSSPTPQDPDRGSDIERCFILSGLPADVKNQVTAAISQLKQKARLVEWWYDSPPPRAVTHVIVDEHPRSVKSLSGLVAGRWIVTPAYVLESLNRGFWLDEAKFGGWCCNPLPLQNRDVVLRIEDPQIREKMVQVVEYGGGRVVTENADSTMLVLTCGDDLLKHCRMFA